MNTSLPLTRSSSSSLQSAPDRRSLMSREVALLAGTNRLPPLIVYDVSFPPSPLFFISPSAPPPSIFPPSLREFMGSFDLSRAVSRSGPTESGAVFYCGRCVKCPTCSTSACPDISGQSNPPGVAAFTAAPPRDPHPLPHFSKWPDVTEPHLHSAVALRKTDFQ